MLFDWLVTGGELPANPAAVRGPKHVVRVGKTPVLTEQEARILLDSLPLGTIVGLRVRALIAVMIYSFARVGAVVKMHIEDYYTQGRRGLFRLHEKGSKHHQLPAHHNAEAYVDAYLEAAGQDFATDRSQYLFPALSSRRELTVRPLHRIKVWEMVQRRARHAGIEAEISCHTLRATGIAAYLETAVRSKRPSRSPPTNRPRPPTLRPHRRFHYPRRN